MAVKYNANDKHFQFLGLPKFAQIGFENILATLLATLLANILATLHTISSARSRNDRWNFAKLLHTNVSHSPLKEV
jgi:hypothetical protein